MRTHFCATEGGAPAQAADSARAQQLHISRVLATRRRFLLNTTNRGDAKGAVGPAVATYTSKTDPRCLQVFIGSPTRRSQTTARAGNNARKIERG
ncbi:hypothetical protein B7486_19595 [cyanobacterium TDX16]|nr:hypothetical protein B7486_19595 [cyanobacterium TDX16]